jgi:DNA-binding response OmpR family regulator
MAYKLLVVDDDHDVTEVLVKRLSREGYEVTAAFDGDEALIKASQVVPDVVLLDLVMPKMNGFEVLKALREKFNEQWIPVIIISAQTDLDSLKKAYGLEADHYLSKPVAFEKVLEGIETMISLIPLRIKNKQ